MDKAQERADKTAADLRRTEAELRVTRVSTHYAIIYTIRVRVCCFIRNPKKAINLFITAIDVIQNDEHRLK